LSVDLTMLGFQIQKETLEDVRVDEDEKGGMSIQM
jgi:hypothetical protein